MAAYMKPHFRILIPPIILPYSRLKETILNVFFFLATFRPSILEWLLLVLFQGALLSPLLELFALRLISFLNLTYLEVCRDSAVAPFLILREMRSECHTASSRLWSNVYEATLLRDI